MNLKIAALIDFTPTSQVVLNFAKALAKTKNATIVLVHISNSSNLEAAKSKLEDMKKHIEQEGVTASIAIQSGDFFNLIKPLLLREFCTMALIGTHGIKGIKQNLLGSNILKLVKMLNMPSLVVQENSIVPPNGFESALIPVGSHQDFEMSIKKIIELLEKNARCSMYAIYKTDELREEVYQKLKVSQQVLLNAGMNTELVREDATIHSIGYSRQTLNYLQKNPHSLVCVMAQNSEEGKYFADIDKENIILNAMQIPVLCFNS